ncbi:MAG: VanZ family protein [Lachnospiraceae bacterium]|nr:VanZ family protein [Lachnospiraceae bacterium]
MLAYISANLNWYEVLLILASGLLTLLFFLPRRDKWLPYTLYWTFIPIYITVIRRLLGLVKENDVTGSMWAHNLLNVALFIPFGVAGVMLTCGLIRRKLGLDAVFDERGEAAERKDASNESFGAAEGKAAAAAANDKPAAKGLTEEILLSRPFILRAIAMTTLAGGILSCLIESTQFLLSCGQADIVDVVTNGVGALMGAGGMVLVQRWWNRKRR